MSEGGLGARIADRIAQAGLTASADIQAAFVVYLELLGRWNSRINLTALPLAPASDDAIDRLIVEPLAAAARVEAADGRLLDIGSGGGSPAIPLRIARPQLSLVMVESKARKCAFLREAVRELGLGGVEVEQHRLEELVPREDRLAWADIATIRAVRADSELWTTARRFVRPGGRIFWFTTDDAPGSVALESSLSLESTERLAATGSRLAVLRNVRI